MKRILYTINYYGEFDKLIMRSLPMSFDACVKRLLKYGYWQNPVLPCVFTPFFSSRFISDKVRFVQLEKYISK